MRVSVITVCYNSELSLEDTILSVVNQTYDDIEYIIIDGASSDRTLEIIDKYKDKIDYFISEPDSGMYNAMNKGIKVATGDYVYILNSDDTLYDENTIQNFVKEANNKNYEVFIGNLIFVEQDGKKPIIKFNEVDKMSMYYFGLHQQALFYKRTIFEKYGYLSEEYKLASDIVWLYDRLFFKKQKLKIKYLDQIFCNFKIGGRSNNESYKKLSDKERSMIAQKYLSPFQMKIYEIYKYKTYPVMHKYFRSIARNHKVSAPVNKAVRGLLRFVFGWEINMVKD